MVHRFVTQLQVDTITLGVVSAHARCLRTRRPTTGIVASHGKPVIEAASATQTVIALSTGESELYAIVRGTGTALGTKSMARDYGREV